jgi:cell division transport system permease protein
MSATRKPIPSQLKEALPTTKKRSAKPLQRALTTYGIHHAQAVLLSLGQLSRVPLTTLMIFIVMGVALALPTGLFLLLKNASLLNQSWHGHSPIMLYLKLPTTEAESAALLQQIQAQPEVENVTYISPEQGLADFKKQSGFGEALDALKENPLPAVLVISLHAEQQTPQLTENLLNSLKTLPQVDSAKLDLDWVQKLDALIKFSTHLIYALAVLLALGVVVVTGSTIHLAIQSHHEEIATYQLLGATDGFIRRPFLYRGALYGLAGGMAALLMTTILLSYLSGPAAALAKLYGSTFSLQGLGGAGNLLFLLLATALGWLGAGVAVFKHRTRI